MFNKCFFRIGYIITNYISFGIHKTFKLAQRLEKFFVTGMKAVM